MLLFDIIFVVNGWGCSLLRLSRSNTVIKKAAVSSSSKKKNSIHLQLAKIDTRLASFVTIHLKQHHLFSISTKIMIFRTVVASWCSLSFASAFTPNNFIDRPATQLNVKVDGRTVGGDLVPANNFILVKVADAEEETSGGILLTGKAKVTKTQGTVVSVGPGKTHPETGAVFDMPVAPGEGVMYGQFDGTEIDLDGAKHTLIRDDDILVKYTGDDLTLENASVVRDAVLVYVETKDVSTDGGILIAKTSKTDRKPSTGKVVKVGPGRFATNGDIMEMQVSEGDFVKFRDFAGNDVTIEDEEYSVVRMSDILAKF